LGSVAERVRVNVGERVRVGVKERERRSEEVKE
jgi:hypothetical protein